MKKKNTFKHTDFGEDIRTFPKQPIWMHSIEKPVDKLEVRNTYLAFLFVCFVLGLLFLIWKILCDGE